MLTKPFKSKVIMRVRTDHLQTGMYVAASIRSQEKLRYILLLNKLDIFINVYNKFVLVHGNGGFL